MEFGKSKTNDYHCSIYRSFSIYVGIAQHFCKIVRNCFIFVASSKTFPDAVLLCQLKVAVVVQLAISR